MVLLCDTHIFPILHMTRVSQIILQNNVVFLWCFVIQVDEFSSALSKNHGNSAAPLLADVG